MCDLGSCRSWKTGQAVGFEMKTTRPGKVMEFFFLLNVRSHGKVMEFRGKELYIQSLEFVVETRILAEMRNENHEKRSFPWRKKSVKIKIMDL